MLDRRLIEISRYLAKHLRHRPERLDIALAAGGWVPIDTLLKACSLNSFPITRQELDEVVARNDKKRYSYDETGTRIRANQGHSVEIDLQLEPVEPPTVLYHGTGHDAVELILECGILKMSRHHVHLSTTIETAKKVGARHGRPVVFQVDSAAMHQEGIAFYCCDNGVWLVDHVPPQFLHRVVVMAKSKVSFDELRHEVNLLKK